MDVERLLADFMADEASDGGRDVARTLTIRIKSARDALAGLRSTFTALQTGRRVSRREGVYFTSIEAARNLLTPNRASAGCA